MPSFASSSTRSVSHTPESVDSQVAAAPVVKLEPQGDPEKDADARRLFELEQIEVSWEEQTATLWTFMRPRGRPSYNPTLLEEFHAWQRGIVAEFGGRPEALRYLVTGSRTPGVFNLGGDLEHFVAKIRDRDRESLVSYGESCVRILHKNLNGLGLPLITVGLAQGDALGGGFESLLSHNLIIAERTAKFGFPESMFGLFPGMGAYNLVSRKIGVAFAEEMMLTGRIYTAEEMEHAGLVHVLAEPGQGIDEARKYIQRNKRRYNGVRAVYEASRSINPLTLDELDRVVQIWADTCLQLREHDLKVMQRLVRAQDRLQYTVQAAE